MAPPLSVDFVYERPTKRKVRFQHEDWGVLYVPNEIFVELGAPRTLTVTLEATPVRLAEAA